MNGALDGGGESAGGSSCSGCHGAIWSGMAIGTSKATKHLLGLDIPRDDGTAGPNPAPTWSGNLAAAVAAANRSCVNMCHGDHPHDLSSPATATHQANLLLDASTPASRAVGGGGAAQARTGATRSATDFDAAAANGGLCLSCHRNPVDAGRPALGKAAFAAAAHNYVTGAGQTWSYTQHDGSVFQRNCTKCHADRGDARPNDAAQPFGAAHFSDYPSLLAGSTHTAGGANSPAVFVCYNCHGNATTGQDLSGKDVAAQIAKTYAHPADADASHDAAAEAATAWGNALGFGVASTVARRHASCLDCHDPHQARPTGGTTRTQGSGTTGNLAGAPLQGATGAALSANPAFWAATGAGSFTYKAIAANADLEATLCFKCHSSFYWGTGTVPTSPSLAAAQTDAAREFNPANVGSFAGTWASGETAGSFHPVLASAGSNLGASDNIKAPFTRTSLMTCTDCHESETAADLNGPHGSTARFLLKGPNTAWSTSLATGSSGMPAGTFCINCHNQNFTGSRFPDHTRSDHRVACMNCHAAVPHGGPRPGLLVAGAGAAAAVGGVLAGWDQAAPYWSGAASNRLYLKTYPTNGTSSWSKSNCGCNGTGH
jgi:hypothetical protein